MVLGVFTKEKYSEKILNTSNETAAYSMGESAAVIKPYSLIAKLTRAAIIEISIAAAKSDYVSLN